MSSMEQAELPQTPKTRRRYGRLALIVSGIVAVALTLGGLYAAYIYASSPEVIRSPKLEHYHFRMQIIVDGKRENFSEQKYQTGYAKDQCNANLPEQPIHFHDNKDQFTHIHWEGMTGGMVMKYYGWNYIGGIDNALGYTLSDLSNIQKVTAHGNYLPVISENTKFFIYTGNADNYSARDFNDWVSQDLEDFFGTTSRFPGHELNQQAGTSRDVLSDLFPTAYAHGTADDADGDDGVGTGSVETEEQKLTRINNLIGNVVIFAQAAEPSEQAIKDRFSDLEPLTESTCGG